MISVDEGRCIGCFACSNVCPNKRITREEGERRIVRWAKCGEECDLCVEFCPEKALTLVLECEETVLSFELLPCRICGSRYATWKMFCRVGSSLPSNLRVDSSGQPWIDICPSCRREMEAERAARETVLKRR